MSTKLKIIILLLFLVQGAVFYWSYSDNKKAEEIALLPYKSYLENPLMVTKIDLKNQGLKELKIDFSQFQNLEYLDLSNNRFEEIPEELFKLPKLKILLLENNKLHISNDLMLEDNESIERLNLSNNSLSSDVICFSCIKNLKYLDLSNNSLNEIPSLQPSSLDTLLLSYNLILDYRIDRLPQNHILSYLDLSNNFSDYEAVYDEPDFYYINVKSINLSNNSLLFPSFLFKMNYENALQKIDLSNCEFYDDINIPQNTIDTILLSNTNIKLNGETFSQFRNLKYLDLSGISYYSFDLFNASLKHLKIDLEKKTFLLLPNLETLSINGKLGDDLGLLFEFGFDSGYFRNLELPNLKTIMIRDYEDNQIKEILKAQFPNIEIGIENYKE